MNLQSDLFTLSNAKTYLGRLMDKARKGEAVFMRGQARFILQEVPAIEPIPFRPAGYFANCYNKAENQQENRLAKASLVHAPKDLE